MDPCEALPPEVFLHIVSFLDPVSPSSSSSSSTSTLSSLLVASAVCQRWRERIAWSEALWRSACLSRFPSSSSSSLVTVQQFVDRLLGLPSPTPQPQSQSQPQHDQEQHQPQQPQQEHDNAMKTADGAEWRVAFGLLRYAQHFVWDPQAKCAGFEIGPATEPDLFTEDKDKMSVKAKREKEKEEMNSMMQARMIRHASSSHGYQWARAAIAYRRGRHQWRVRMRPRSNYTAVGVFPEQFDDWTSSFMEWDFSGGYFYAPFGGLLHARLPQHVPAFRLGNNWRQCTLEVLITLDLNARTIAWRVISLHNDINNDTNNSDNKDTDGPFPEVTANLREGDEVFYPAIVAGTRDEHFALLPPKH